MDKTLQYCIGCDQVLVGESFKYCGNPKCTRYGLFTALLYSEPPDPPDRVQPGGGAEG
jgi:hypothetical protein